MTQYIDFVADYNMQPLTEFVEPAVIEPVEIEDGADCSLTHTDDNILLN